MKHIKETNHLQEELVDLKETQQDLPKFWLRKYGLVELTVDNYNNNLSIFKSLLELEIKKLTPDLK